MDKAISEHVIKLHGKATLEKELDLSHAFKVELDGAVDQTIDEDNQDGSYTRYYRFRPILAKIIADNGEITKTKDARSRSQQMRATIRREWQLNQSSEIDNDYYDNRMLGLIKRIIDGEI